MIDFDKAICGDYNGMTDTELRAYKAVYDDGYHNGDVVDFENAVMLCHNALVEQHQKDVEKFIQWANTYFDGIPAKDDIIKVMLKTIEK